MALHNDILVPANGWVAISSGSITTPVRVQNLGNETVFVQGTATNVAPTSLGGAIRVFSGSGERVVMAQDFGGVATAAYLWATAHSSGIVSVSHG